MLHRKSLPLLFLLFFAFTCAFAQTGSIKGNVKDAKTNEPLIGAAVSIQGTTTGSAVDVEGNFFISKVAAGKHNLLITYVGYKTKTIEIQVESGKQIVLNTTLDEEGGIALDAVVIVGERAKGTEIAVISEIKSIQQVAVGVGSQQIAKSPDRDAAQVARRVPGVSIIDNRFVLVRGLGQRYNSVLINNVIAPSTEVDSRAFSFDMVPSQIIDRMLIYKSGAADLPGEFAGGVIKIYTKRAPEENFLNVGISTGYRINTTFQSIQRQQTSGLTFLGSAGKDRQIPGSFPAQASVFKPFSDQEKAAFENQLGNKWGLRAVNAPLDIRANFSLGRRFNVGSVQIGNLTGINYSSTNANADVSLNTFVNGSEAGNYATQYKDQIFGYNSRLGIMHNWSFRFNPNFTLEFKNLFNQLGFEETVVRNGQNFEDDKQIRSYSQRFESRSIYSGQLLGTHSLKNGKLALDWVLGYSNTNRSEPDWRRLVYSRRTSDEPFSAEVENRLQTAARFFSKLNESVYTAAVNGEYKIGEGEEPIKIKSGIYTEQKNRKFSARWFGYDGGNNVRRTDPIDAIFSPSNVTGTSIQYFTIEEGTQWFDKYTAHNTLLAGYVSGFFSITDRLSATAGFRLEYNQQQMKSLPLPDSDSNEKAIKVNNTIVSPLPSLNLTYDLSDKQLIRLAYAYTVNRPEFRELAPFLYYDFNLNANVQGNEKLKIAQIQNIDFRWEYYPSPNELVSVGGFYKNFTNPIENFLPQRGGPSILDYTFINAKSAYSYGIEAEIRKSFSELSGDAFLKNITLQANASYIISRINLGDFVTLPSGISNDPYDAKSITDVKRPMMNQSPYLINAGAYYSNEETGWQASILYNVYGKRIFAVGNILNPTVYEMPRNVIDITVTKTFAKKWEARLAVQDILNQAVRLEQDFTRDSDINSSDNQTIRSFKKGSYVTVGLSYSF